MRDWVTKALVQLLRGHLDAMRVLFERFWTVDDPYVVQRVVAIAYQALLRRMPDQADEAKALADAVHSRVFARQVRPDELMLDAARASRDGQWLTSCYPSPRSTNPAVPTV